MAQAGAVNEGLPRHRRVNAWAVIVVFGLLVLLPFLAQLVGLGPTSGENRTLASFPKIESPKEIKDLPRMLDAYVNDRFGLRSQLVRLNGLARFKLGISSTKDVVIGKDGWLFITADSVMEQHTGANVFSAPELEHWVASMQNIRDCLMQRGIPFYIVFAPDKSTIYPEKLPNYPRSPRATTRFDQVVERLKRTNIEFVDPRAELLKVKAEGAEIYSKGDTHWTERGAFEAYRLLMDKVRKRFPNLEVLTLGDFDVGTTEGRGADLAVLLALDGVLRYPGETLVRKNPSHQKEQPSTSMRPGWGWRVVEIHNDLADKPRLLVFGDSFTDYILGPYFLYETFRDPVWTHHNGGTLNLHLVDEFKPDIVVMQMADRYLHLVPLKPVGLDALCP
jgi:alginate O-acetyltransferase complex protein AlgJ